MVFFLLRKKSATEVVVPGPSFTRFGTLMEISHLQFECGDHQRDSFDLAHPRFSAASNFQRQPLEPHVVIKSTNPRICLICCFRNFFVHTGFGQPPACHLSLASSLIESSILWARMEGSGYFGNRRGRRMVSVRCWAHHLGLIFVFLAVAALVSGRTAEAKVVQGVAKLSSLHT